MHTSTGRIVITLKEPVKHLTIIKRTLWTHWENLLFLKHLMFSKNILSTFASGSWIEYKGLRASFTPTFQEQTRANLCFAITHDKHGSIKALYHVRLIRQPTQNSSSIEIELKRCRAKREGTKQLKQEMTYKE